MRRDIHASSASPVASQKKTARMLSAPTSPGDDRTDRETDEIRRRQIPERDAARTGGTACVAAV